MRATDLSTPPGYAFGRPPARGRIRVYPEDFEVHEALRYVPGGAGQHVWLRIRKRLLNTDQLAARLARFARRHRGAVSYAGMKDRLAVAEQWFSIDMGGAAEPDWTRLNDANIEVVYATRHHRKLRRGGLAGNRFVLRVRECDAGRQGIEDRLAKVREAGVPNYFGAQRFGRNANNIEAAYRMFADGEVVRDRHLRGLYLSAARALLFNHVLSERVGAESWNRVIDGDVMMLDGTHSIFPAEPGDTALESRLRRFDIHPTGPLWGRGQPPTRAAALEVENHALRGCEVLQAGLEAFGLKHERRPLRLKVSDLTVCIETADVLRLAFVLPAGGYATMVLRELVDVEAGGPCGDDTDMPGM